MNYLQARLWGQGVYNDNQIHLICRLKLYWPIVVLEPNTKTPNIIYLDNHAPKTSHTLQCNTHQRQLDTSESKSWTLTKGMNEVSIHVPYILGNKQNSKTQIQKEDITEDTGTWSQERPVVGPNRSERGKLTHGNLQISKCLCIIIRSCNSYKC